MLGGVGDGRRRRESSGGAAAVVGEAAGGAVDSGLLRSIPSTRRERSSRRTFPRSSFCSGRAQSTAMRAAMAARRWLRGERKREREERKISGQRSGAGGRRGAVLLAGVGKEEGPGVACVRQRDTAHWSVRKEQEERDDALLQRTPR